MKRAVLLLLVCLGATWAAPVEEGGPEAASCTDPVVLGAAAQAMDKINKDRTEGYVFSLRDLANAHMQKHGENSIVFYLTMNVQETNCSVLSKMNFKDCEVRDISGTPVYGQCKVAIFISRVNRVVRLYKYNCVVRPVPAEHVSRICPDCPSHTNKDSEEVKKTVSKSLEKFNKASGLSKYFALGQVTRATSGWGMGMGMYYNVQYTIQETTCANPAEKPEDCPLMDCEFAHKGFCKSSHIHAPGPDGEENIEVTCEVYEPEAAVKEKKLHVEATDHSHNDTDVTNPEQGHDHQHDHTKGHATHTHAAGDHHHHDHDHAHSHGGHRHAHDHGHGHNHEHAHHEKAHNHTNDNPNQHHDYGHAAGVNTHHHDHEMALDHDHKHAHMHDWEHHHHHHGHDHHDNTAHHHPEGVWRQIPALGGPVTLPAFPDVPVAGPEVGVTLPLKPDPEIPGQTEPTIGPFPTKRSAECPLPAITDEGDIVAKLLSEDPEFNLAA